MKFLEELSEKLGKKPFIVFMDNLMVHKSYLARDAYNRLQITPIYNIPYSPQFNGIESYFSLLKGEYKKELLQKLMHDRDFSVIRLIKRSVILVDDEKTRACARNGTEAIDM